MRELIEGRCAEDLILTDAKLRLLTERGLDALATWLVAHAPCALVPDTVQIDAPRWEYGAAYGLRARCATCKTEADLAVDLARTAPGDWWLGLSWSMLVSHP